MLNDVMTMNRILSLGELNLVIECLWIKTSDWCTRRKQDTNFGSSRNKSSSLLAPVSPLNSRSLKDDLSSPAATNSILYGLPIIRRRNMRVRSHWTNLTRVIQLLIHILQLISLGQLIAEYMPIVTHITFQKIQLLEFFCPIDVYRPCCPAITL